MSDPPAGAPRDQRPAIPAYALWSAILAVLVVAILTVAGETAWQFNGTPIDGPFQLYNALRRIQAGFRPGIDFQYFHGLGVPYLHYAFYRLLGGDLPASELARELISATLFPAVFVAVFRAFSGSWLRALLLTVAAISLTLAIRANAVVFALNSMIGLRSTVPMLVPVGMVVTRARPRRIVVTGALLGFAAFVSSEHGMAILAAFILVAALASFRCTERRRALLEYITTVGLAVAVFLLMLLAVAGPSGGAAALRYNFGAVPGDQYWYFGAPPNPFLATWAMAAKAMVLVPPVGCAVLLGIVAAAWQLTRLLRTRDASRDPRQFALSVLAVYGMLSCASLLAIFDLANSQSGVRVLLVIGLLELQRHADRGDSASANARIWLGAPRWLAATALACFGVALLATPLVVKALTVSVGTLPKQLAIREPFSTNAMWRQTLQVDQETIDSARAANGRPPVVWSTYAGWAEARAGLFHPSTDYLIHVLGPTLRERYVAAFRQDQPDLVQTVRPGYTAYELWLENEDWAFYGELLQRYRPITVTPWSIWWTRRSMPLPEARLVFTGAIPAGASAVPVPVPASPSASAAPRLFEVELTYEVHNPLHALPIIGVNPRYLVSPQGALNSLTVSLDPYTSRMRFPLALLPGQRPTLSFQTVSLLPGASVRLDSIRVFEWPLEASQNSWFSELLLALSPSRG